MMGGGSANLAPHYRISPLDAIRAAFGDAVDVRYERALDFDVTAPPVDTEFSVDWFAGRDHAGAPVATSTLPGRAAAPGRHATDRRRRRRLLVPRHRCATRRTRPESHTLSLIQIGGRARVLLDGVVVLDGIADPPGPGAEYFGMGSAEVEATVELVAGQSVDLVVEFVERDGFFMRGMKLGVRPPSPPDLLERAVATARDADAVVVVVGTNADWETEGRDRETMHLPGAQDELVARVVTANPNTVVVVNTGAPVAMPWADDARAVLQAWFGGQEMANALADILVGDAEPGGRLPTTLPVRLEHNPSFGNFPGENGEVRYGEGVLVGYRWYEARRLPTRFPFGHGLSYTTFDVRRARGRVIDGDRVTVSVPVTNTGDRRGSEVVQCYVGPPQPSRLVRPPKELKAFAKVGLDPGEQTTVALDARRARLRLLGSGRSAHRRRHARLAGRPRHVHAARRTLVGRHHACPHGRTLTVRRVILHEFGPYSNLVFEDRPDPVPDTGQAVVAIEAAGIGFVDTLCVHGTYQLLPALPWVPGCELAGRVVAVGDGMTRFAVGDRVLATSFAGSFQTHTVLREDELVPIPGDLTAGQAAGLVASYGTMLYAYTRRTTVAPDEWVVVLGAGGGVGLAATDVAKALGARVDRVRVDAREAGARRARRAPT